MERWRVQSLGPVGEVAITLYAVGMRALFGHNRPAQARWQASSSYVRLHVKTRAVAPPDKHAAAQAVLEWATGNPSSQLAARVVERPGMGRGLIAAQDIQAATTILNVPIDQIYSSKPEDDLDLHWSADMALRLLTDRHQGQLSPWHTWLSSLPSHVSTPLEFTQQELAHIRDPNVRTEVDMMQECMQACYQELQPELDALDYDWDDFIGAVQLLHSRCFYFPETGCHVAVPGIDMANHSIQPNARVEVRHSPGAVQGVSALADIADPDVVQRMSEQPGQFMLVAGPEGIKQGQEITISYGPWPDTAFFLLFGFLPQDNPNKAVVLFSDLRDVMAALLHHFEQQPGSHTPSVPSLAELLEIDQVQPDHTWMPFAQMVVTGSGWDGRLQRAVVTAAGLINDLCAQQLAAKDASGLSGEDGQRLAKLVSSCGQVVEWSKLVPLYGQNLAGLVQAVTVHAVRHKLTVLRAAAPADVSKATYGQALAAEFTSRQVSLLEEVLSKLS